MKQELQDKLFEAFPLIFAEKDLSMQESCMYWGIACGDGWFDLVWDLCADLQIVADMDLIPQPVAAQVKEKFGGLRFCLNSHNDAVGALVGAAEELAWNTCENCGSTEDIKTTRGYISRLCAPCFGTIEERREAKWAEYEAGLKSD
jgi:hypothetical protein